MSRPALVSGGAEPALERRDERRRRFRAKDILNLPAPLEIVQGVAWAGNITLAAAESGAGKTFTFIDLASAVAEGTPWHGREIVQGSVVYCLFEGDAIGRRLRAVQEVHGRQLDYLHIILASEPLSPRVTREGEETSSGERWLAAELSAIVDEITAAGEPPVHLVFIDTVRASMSGSEDSSEHVSAYLRAVRRIAERVPTAGIILSHHVGWQDGEERRRRERGSSAWRGNVDATLYLEAGELDPHGETRRLTLQTKKVRDGECPPPLRLVRRRVVLAERDARGREESSCVIERDWTTPSADAALNPSAANDALDRELLTLIAERPDLASAQSKLRVALNVRNALVNDSIGRLVRAEYIAPPARRGLPYTVTPLGQAYLRGLKP